MAKAMKTVNQIALWLVALGAINWLTSALLNFDVVATIAGLIPTVSGVDTLLYSLIGASGAWVGFLVLMKRVTLK